MTLAGTAASTPTGTAAQIQAASGLASFNSAYFTASSAGWISLASSNSVGTTGIPYSKLQYVSANRILGNLDTVNPTNITELTPGSVVTAGDGIKNASFAASGAMIVSYNSPNTASNSYSVTTVSTTHGNGVIVKSDATTGAVDVTSLKVNGSTTLSIDTTTLTLTTPSGNGFITAIGTNAGDTVITTSGTLYVPGTLKVSAITSSNNSAATNISLTGTYQVQANSVVDFKSYSGTLLTNNITSGGTTDAVTMTGNYQLQLNGTIDTKLGKLKASTITTGADSGAGSAGELHGQWTVYGGLTFDTATGISFGTGTLDITNSSALLKSRTLKTGAAGTSGKVQGAWTLDNDGSTFVASSISNQSNSATTEATTGLGASGDAVIASKIVLRDGNGDFKARDITFRNSNHSGSISGVTGITGSGDIGSSVAKFGTVYASTFSGTA
jgi:hypothetical protein